MVGPDYVRPQVSLNADWSERQDPRLAADVAANVAWWKTLSDPALDQLIDLAFHQNLPLQIAALRILEARAQLGIAIGNYWPEGGPSARGTAVGISKYAPTGALADRHFGDFDIGFDATWELDVWGKFRRGSRAANAEYLASIADYEGALVSLAAEVARAYVQVRTFEVLIQQARDNEKIQVEGLDIAQARFKNGATGELDVAQATNLLETTRATIPKLEMGRQQSENALSTLLGRPTNYVRDLLVSHTGIPVPPTRVSISVPAELLRRRPDIRAAELRAMAQCDRIGVAKADFYPKLTLFGFIGTEASVNAGPLSNNSSLAKLFAPGSLAYNAGASVLWPLLNYKRIKNNVRVQESRYGQLLVEYVNQVLVASQEVEDGMTGYLREQDSAVFSQNAVTAADNAVKLALIQYREGAVDYQRVLDTQRVLLDSQNQLAQTRSAVVTNLIALYKALGGGWEVWVGAPLPGPARGK